jgi:uncharacterized lipoprotein YajG
MKAKIALWIGATALGCMALAGCGGSNNTASNTPPPTVPAAPTTQLDTAEVLAVVQTKTSDTTAPFQVDNGAVAVTPTGDETGEPISVDGT